MVHECTRLQLICFLSLMELMSVIKEGVGDASNVPAAVAQLLAILQVRIHVYECTIYM